MTDATTADHCGTLDEQILDALTKLFAQILAEGEAISVQFGVPTFCVKALHILDAAMPMKELGQRMKCDPSFVTAIADVLEKRGLATREPNATDRRVKNLVLSTEGIELKRRVEKEMVGRMAWSRVFDMAERTSFLALIRKLVDAGVGSATPGDAAAASAATPSGGGRAGEPVSS